MHIHYCDTFVLPLPPHHRFPMAKYRMLRERVLASGLLPTERICEPIGATDEQLLLVHDPAYIERVKTGTLSPLEIRRIGFPWSLGMVQRSRRSVGGTIGAARSALQYGAGVNLAGGTHHAGYDYGSGFCVFNDVVVAARVMQHEGLVCRVLIVDADVHQGEGTAALCEGDSTIFTFSIHAEKNFPFRKYPSDLDIGLADGTGDAEYLAQFEMGLLKALSMAQADLVFYIGGADPYIDDRLGRLALSKAGLAERDRILYDICGSMNLPVATVMGGGYSPQLEDIVDIHFMTVSLAVRYGRQYA
ncbi:MAG: histone deacetylase [Phototrophicales bacterium]|nr:MAG: histone deacetylase [Phototrophicales bacterium]